MIYQYFKASPAVQEFVKDHLIAHFVFNKDEQIPFKPYSPKPEQTITFLAKGHLTLVNPENGDVQHTSAASICGQQVSRYNFLISAEYLMVRIHFHPGALYRLLGIPLSEFTNDWFNAEAVISREILEINEQLANCCEYSQMIEVVEKYLLSKIKRVKHEIHSVDNVASCILADPSRFSLDWLASQACLCHRQFNRKFIERMGVSPKLYSRIVRFYKAYQYKEQHPREDWLSVALLFGYSDYQHMVKDFKEFARVTPSLWIGEDNQSPERILQLE